MSDSSWKTFDPSGLRTRLERVRALLVQAAAVGLARDSERLEQLAELERQMRAPAPPPPARRKR